MTKIVLPMIILSFLLSLMLSLLPLSEGLLELNPSWCLLTLLFWTYHYPHRVNVGIAGCVGILVDGLSGSLLGLHVFAYVSVVFLFDLFYRRFHMFHVLQQSLVIGILIACNFVIIISVKHILTDNLIDWSVMLSVITSMLCWPFYCLLGQKFHLIRG
ncbi:MAG: rod shape-determining protein MreD [Pseudomonadota bacterium]